MLFPEEDAPLLKAWIVKRLEDTCVYPRSFSHLVTTKANHSTGTGLMQTPMSLLTTSSPSSGTTAPSMTFASSARTRYPTFSRKVC